MRMSTVLGALTLALTAAACGVPTETDPNIAQAPTATGAPDTGGSPAGKADDGMHTVVYKVGGTTRSGSVTYTTPSGQEQNNDARIPWKKTFKAKDAELLSVTAQNSGTGTVTCSIVVDGKEVKRSKSSGAYALVSCDGMIGF